jgi:hypothetical protein
MQAQNFKNHTRLVPSYHFVLWSVVLALDILAILQLIFALKESQGILPSVIFILIAVALSISAIQIRRFPLIAQDRAIRAEENLRHFVLTGKLPDSRLTITQIIALRFAPDEELGGLTERAATENLSSSDIKKAIQEWRADYYRV